MKLSAKSRYAIRAMFYIVLNVRDGNHISLKEISENENISIKYLEQIFTGLRKEGIVKSIKGSYGGYVLGIEKKELTIGKIIRAVEGNIYSINADEKKEYGQNSIEYYMITKFWEQLDNMINGYMDEKTLEVMTKDYVETTGQSEDDLYTYRNSYI